MYLVEAEVIKGKLYGVPFYYLFPIYGYLKFIFGYP